jgi:excisionase family DNA binding protein
MAEYYVSAHPDSTGELATHSDDGLAFWTPVLGPTAMLLAYFLAMQVEGEGPGKVLQSQLSTDLAVMPSKVESSLNRLARRNIIDREADQILIHLNLPYPHPAPGPVAEALTLTIPEAAALLGISRSAAYTAARTGELPTVQIGRRYLVPRHRLNQLLKGEEND